MKSLMATLTFCTALGGTVSLATAAEISMAANEIGAGQVFLQAQAKRFEEKTGHKVNIVAMPSSSNEVFAQYRLWLAAGNTDVDVYKTDVIWAPQLADQFVDLTEAAKEIAPGFFESIIASQTVDGKLVAVPLYTDAPALYYRKDLLEKYGKQPPKTWDELTATAKEIQDKEREAGQKDLWGIVFQGAAYEGLTCNALEWIKSSGGGQIVEPDGTISVNNPNAAAAIDRVRGWIGTIAPPGVLAYQEEDARGVWQSGNAVFMRNWPYAYTLGNSADSAVKGKFDVSPLPINAEGDMPSSTLGGWNLAVSKYSKEPEVAIEFVKFVTSPEEQKLRTMELSNLPTLKALYDDADIAKAQPIIPNWKAIFESAVPRPSAATKSKYNEVSSRFWTAVSKSLAGDGTAAENLELLEIELTDLKGNAW